MSLKSLIQNDNKKFVMIIDFQIDFILSGIVNDLQVSLKMRHHSIILKYGSVFLLWNIFAQILIVEFFNESFCMLIEIELRRLHWRFDHSSIRRLQVILDRSYHNVDSKTIDYLIKYCHYCQVHEKFWNRLSFTLKNDLEFNYNVIVNIFYLEIKSDVNKSILHVMNETTRF
jgi:hypothetical protein